MIAPENPPESNDLASGLDAVANAVSALPKERHDELVGIVDAHLPTDRA